MHGGEDLSGVLFTRYIKDGYRNTLFTNYSGSSETIQVKVATNEKPEIWNTFTGDVSVAKIISSQSNEYLVEIELPCNYGVFLVSKIIPPAIKPARPEGGAKQ
jgi:hypothetical protein